MALPDIARHIRNYGSASLLTALGGLVTFPILTRTLSVQEYGILGLLTASVTLFVAVGKMGVQHSIIRHYEEVRQGNSGYTPAQLVATVSWLLLLLTGVTTAVWLLFGTLVIPHWSDYPSVASLFCVVAIILVLRQLSSGAVNFLRAQQRSEKVAQYQVIQRYVQLGLLLLLLLTGQLGLWQAVLCLVAAEILATLYIFYFCLPLVRPGLVRSSRSLAKLLLSYGLPLMVLESLGLVLRISDRYIIEAQLGEEFLGQYAASYNLTSYLETILLFGVLQAVRPMYTRLWETEGQAATQGFLSRGLHLYCWVGLPVIAVFSLTAPGLLDLLASPKYSAGTVVIPYVALSFLLEGEVMFLGAGLYLRKKTRALMVWGMVATVVNLVLNILLIPRYGIVAAAAVTVLSYVVFMGGIASSAFRQLSFPVNPRPWLLMAVVCWLVFLVMSHWTFESRLLTMFARGLGASLVLGAVAWYANPVIPELLREQRSKIGLGQGPTR